MIFVDRNDQVVKIHTGFNGPATSEFPNFKKDFEVEPLEEERAFFCLLAASCLLCTSFLHSNIVEKSLRISEKGTLMHGITKKCKFCENIFKASFLSNGVGQQTNLIYEIFFGIQSHPTFYY